MSQHAISFASFAAGSMGNEACLALGRRVLPFASFAAEIVEQIGPPLPQVPSFVGLRSGLVIVGIVGFFLVSYYIIDDNE